MLILRSAWGAIDFVHGRGVTSYQKKYYGSAKKTLGNARAHAYTHTHTYAYAHAHARQRTPGLSSARKVTGGNAAAFALTMAQALATMAVNETNTVCNHVYA